MKVFKIYRKFVKDMKADFVLGLPHAKRYRSQLKRKLNVSVCNCSTFVSLIPLFGKQKKTTVVKSLGKLKGKLIYFLYFYLLFIIFYLCCLYLFILNFDTETLNIGCRLLPIFVFIVPVCSYTKH